MFDVRPLALEDVLEIRVPRFADSRGFFSEVWSRPAWESAGIALDFVQDNHSLSTARGVLRGLHFQRPPFAQDKLIRVTRGRIFDVAVDVRAASPTYGRWAAIELSAGAWNQLLVPKGFAHGFLTLEENCEVQYKVTAPYSREHEIGIRFDDPAIAITWPFPVAELHLSDKDRAAPFLSEVKTRF